MSFTSYSIVEAAKKRNPKPENFQNVFGWQASQRTTFEPAHDLLGLVPTSQRKQSIYKWLRDRTSSLDIGVEIDGKDGRHPIHINTNIQVLEHFDRLRRGGKSFLERFDNEDFRDHFTNRRTFYFAGTSQRKNPETLVLIDIDCKKTGTLQGALAFAEHLKKHHFPNLYIEPSTHGRGGHGFFVVEQCDLGAEYINDLLLHRLQPWLRQILKEHDFDVENVEIKGTLPVLIWGKERLELTNYKSGTLAKLPRLGSPDKEEALRTTTRVSVSDLQRLPIVEPRRPKSGSVARTATVVAGSISGKVIDDAEIKKIDGHYGLVAETLLEAHEMRTAGRTVVTVRDVAIFLLQLRFFTKHMNVDGSLPVKRWKHMWDALFGAGDIDRAFCPQRFKAIRDHLSSLGLLDWQDESYWIGWHDQDGKYHKGKACKWQASNKLMEMLEVPAEQAVDKEGEGKTSFIRTRLLSELKSIAQLPPEETKRPFMIEFDSHLRLNPGEINRFITPFEAFTGLAA